MDMQVLVAFGGVGLFLLGMLILTDGLRGLAGRGLRQWLARYTTNPAKGVAAGALTTAVVQSSSATTVTAVGFVGAGLLTFPQAIGIVFGANIGTTVTGWLVVLVGFKLSLGDFALPFVFVGTLLRMFSHGPWRHLGWTLAGFGLLFIGIDTMQQGMAPLRGSVTPADFPSAELPERLLLVLIGAAITIVTQSSSAGVATALVALGAGAISYPQAAAMVIGMDVGTTFTALLATIGGSAAMRQTALAHTTYNLIAGGIAFFLLGPLSAAVAPWTDAGAGNAQIALVAYHSFYNTLGVLLLLPVARQFARAIQKAVPERGMHLVRRLDRQLLRDPEASTDAAVATIRQIMGESAALLAIHLSGRMPPRQRRKRMAELAQALEQARGFVERIRTDPGAAGANRRHQAAVHSLDHLARLMNRMEQDRRIAVLSADHRLGRLAGLLRRELEYLVSSEDWRDRVARFDKLRSILRRQRRSYRATIIVATTHAAAPPEQALDKLDGLRWLHRVAYHIWRIVHHLEVAALPKETIADDEEPSEDPETDET